jgi:hypothetical protein
MERATIGAWVHRCSNCGYASNDLEKENSLPASFLQTSAYRDACADQSMPDLARKFICWALCLTEMKEHAKAGRQLLNAAWACDDASGVDSEPSKVCRRRSLEAYARAKEAGLKGMDQKRGDELVQIDLLRRVGDFDGAIALANETLKMSLESFLEKIVQGQIKFAEARDARVHTMGEI